MPIYTPGSDSQSESSKMKLIFFSNEFPHDLTGLFRQLHNYSKNRRYPVLASFLDEATLAIRDEIRRLPATLRALVPPFESILNFVDFEELQKGPLSGSVEGILLCIAELATIIGYHENSDGKYDFDTENMSVTGLGIGLLASAAVSISPALTHIPIAGAEVMRIVFRLGVHVDEVSQNLEMRDSTGPPKTWAYVVPRADAEDVQNELDTVQSVEKTPETSKIFISAVSETSVTISGPPSRLDNLFRDSDFLRGCKPIALPVYGGLCHAKHIYNQNNVHAIVGTSSIDMLNSKLSPRIPVYSTGKGRPYMAKSAKDLFEQVVSELLTQQIHWARVVQGIVEYAHNFTPSEYQLLVFRNSLPVQELLDALKSGLPDLEVTTEDLLPWVSQSSTYVEAPSRTMHSKIAIVGMACRMPSGATDTEKFWDILEKGLDVHRKIPADRFDVNSHTDSTGRRVNTSHTPYGCFIDEPGLFDAAFFNMSPREAEQTDPMQRLALVTAYEALEKAGYVANRTAATNLHRIGTFYGQASDDYREVNTAQEISTYFIPGGCRAFGPGRINYFFKFSGPSFSCDTACSSSLATIQAACTSLWNGDTDTVVAGGMNVLTNSDAFAGLSHGHFLSKTPNACKTWDSEADGYVRADGIGSIVMKRLEDAEADNDNILGVILGAATNHSAEAISITHPHAGAQSYLYRRVLSRAGLDPFDISFVEMHGTGTQAGDSVEIKSITDVFAPIKKPRSSKQPLYIGAVKSNVGHGEAVAGVTALLKVLLMFEKSAIPPHVGIKHSINPGFPKDFDRRNLHIPYKIQSWPHVAGKKRIAIVNNFSAAGGNTTVAIEEPPVREEPKEIDPRRMHVVAMSAKSKVSLKGNLERLIAYLDANPDVSLSNLSYSTTVRRYHHNHRLAISTSDYTQLKKQLIANLGKVDTHKPIPTTGLPPIAFAFTGQGASYRSMNLELFQSCPYFRSQILYLDSLAQGQGFPSFVPAIDGSHKKDFQHPPVITQLALVCSEIALAKYWESLGVKPSVVIGHSLGEYAALHIVGVLSASDTISLVGQRARLFEQRCQIGGYKMMAVRCSLAELEKGAGGLPYEVACINGPEDTVVSGTQEQVTALSNALEANGHKCICLEVAFAFHSEQTEPVLDDFEELAKGVVFRAPNLPVISPLLSKVIFDDETLNANYMRRATREPVNFLSGVEMAQKLSIIDETTIWVEVGPHPVCTGFIKATIPSVNVAVPSLRRDEVSWTTIAQSLAALHCIGVQVSWSEFHRPFEGGLRFLDLPTYSWNDKNYWIMYNGDWALTKGNSFYDAEKVATMAAAAPASKSDLSTSTIHHIIAEDYHGTAGKVVMQADLMKSDFHEAAYGHKMNGCGVVTSSIHADIAYTLGEYLYKKLQPQAAKVDMNFTNLEVAKGLVAKRNRATPQIIQVSAETGDIYSEAVSLKWYNVHSDGTIDEPFASANIIYGDAAEWLTSWVPITHLLQSRIQDLERQAEAGSANKFSHNYAYLLFANNLVDYSAKYRGMQSVILQGLEAVADVVLSKEKGGTWTIPPYFIDSVAHLAGFIMNVSDSIDTNANFCVTPGFRSMRFAEPLVAGNKYRSYVKMIPTPEDPTVYLGDVYIFQDAIIVGMVGGMQFRRYPRILLNRFFSAPDDVTSSQHTNAVASKVPTDPPKAIIKPAMAIRVVPTTVSAHAKPTPTIGTASTTVPAALEVPNTLKPPSETTTSRNLNHDLVSVKALKIIAEQTGIQLGHLQDESSFASLGVDSLMSLVIAENFREQLGIAVGGGLFLEYPTIGDLRVWLEDYYN